MKLKRILTLTAAAALTTALLTGCPWEQDDAASSEPSSSSSSPSRPEPDEPDEPNEPEEPDEPDEPAGDEEGGGEEPEKDPDAPKVELSEDGTTLTVTGGSGELTTTVLGSIDKSKITTLNLSGSGYTGIGSGAFQKCVYLTSIDLPEGLKTIESSAFQGTGLTSVTLPEGLTSIGESAFFGCTNLNINVWPNSLTSIGESAFQGCTDLTSITLPDGLTTIGADAFNGCTNLTKIKLPNSPTTIGDRAFQGTGLTDIYVGDGILSADATIGNNAFYGVGMKETTVMIHYPSDWEDSEKEKLKEKLNSDVFNNIDDIPVTVNYEPYDELTQTTSELPNGVKGLMEAARLFGLG